MTRVLLTGSSGFIGSALLRQFVSSGDVEVRPLVRSVEHLPAHARTGAHLGDLTDPASLTGACDGVDVVVHAASYVGPDADLCARVNQDGTASLVDEARRAGATRFLYISTAAVYGSGPHRGIDEDAVELCPRSPVSETRAHAEVVVRDFGGCVLRPHLVYGPRDRWVVPALAALLARMPWWVDGGEARLSMINVRDLARAACALAIRATPSGAVYHANHPEPVRFRDAATALAGRLGLRPPAHSVPYREAVLRLPPGLPRRHVDMIGVDHWYASQRLWELSGTRPGMPFPHDLAAARSWYPDLAWAAGDNRPGAFLRSDRP